MCAINKCVVVESLGNVYYFSICIHTSIYLIVHQEIIKSYQSSTIFIPNIILTCVTHAGTQNLRFISSIFLPAF